MDPENRTINIMDANYDAAIGDYTKAERKYRKIYEADSSDLYYLLKIAEMKQKKGEREEANAIFSRIIEKDPYYIYTYYSLIKIAEEEERYQDAVNYNKYLMSIEPGYNPSKLYFPMRQLGMLDSANYYLDMGFKKFPNDQYTIELKAWSLVKDEKYTEAIPIYEELLRTETYSSSTFSNLSICYYYTNQRDRCIESAYWAIKYDPYDLSLYTTHFKFLFNLNCSKDTLVELLIRPIRDFGVEDQTYLMNVSNNFVIIGADAELLSVATKGMNLYPDDYRFYFFLAIYCHNTKHKYLYDYIEAAYSRGMPCELLQDYKDYLPNPEKDAKYRKISKKICNL
jgi:tetratricopeptide (TPR) repeat protein